MAFGIRFNKCSYNKCIGEEMSCSKTCSKIGIMGVDQKRWTVAENGKEKQKRNEKNIQEGRDLIRALFCLPGRFCSR